jgi:hypothetical protein
VSDHISEWLDGFGGLRLNEKASAADLGKVTRSGDFNWGVDWDGSKLSLGVKLGIQTNQELGEGAVAKAFAISSAIGGSSFGPAMVNRLYGSNSAAWMRHLPHVNGLPAHYFACGFNDYVGDIFNLQFLAKLAGKGPPQTKLGAQVLGTWLGYTNMLVLMVETVDDLTRGLPPPQPPGRQCPISWP